MFISYFFLQDYITYLSLYLY